MNILSSLVHKYTILDRGDKQMDDKDLLRKLSAHPELRKKVEQLVVVVDDENEEHLSANQVEYQIIEILRDTGSRALQEWATKQNELLSTRLKKQKPTMRKHKKKD